MHQKGNFMIIVAVIVAALLGGYALMKNSKEAAPVAEAPEEIVPVKIGFMGPLTGDAASYGESIKKGVDLAKKELGLALLHESPVNPFKTPPHVR